MLTSKWRSKVEVGALALIVALVAAGTVRSVDARSVHGHAGQPRMGPSHMGAVREWTGYYDGHRVVYLSTDVSSRQEAGMMGVNFAPGLQHANAASMPEIYLVRGRAASNQLAVFGSEPGESDYSPLWRETIVSWKAGASPVVITSDNQVNTLEKKGQLTERNSSVLLNCPIIRVM